MNLSQNRINSVIQTIVAVAGLLTAVASFVKTFDKRLEQASYEALSESIKSIQEDQKKLHSELTRMKLSSTNSGALLCDVDEDGVYDYIDDIKESPDSGMPIIPSPSSSFKVPSLNSASSSKNLDPLSPKPPPAWNAIKLKADSL